MSSAYNGLTQRVQCELHSKGFKVNAAIVQDSQQMKEAVNKCQP